MATDGLEADPTKVDDGADDVDDQTAGASERVDGDGEVRTVVARMETDSELLNDGDRSEQLVANDDGAGEAGLVKSMNASAPAHSGNESSESNETELAVTDGDLAEVREGRARS